MEIWKNLWEFPDYQISNYGKIKSNKYHKQSTMKLDKNNKGYYRIRLSHNGKVVKRYTHILVYETFYDDKLKSNECIHHKDENKENNYYENLEKLTKSKHKSIHNKGEIVSKYTRKKLSENRIGKKLSKETKNKISEKLKGENHPRHKLTEQQVVQIKLLLKEVILTQQEIADMFEVSQLTISAIKTGRSWSYIRIV